MVSEHCGEQIVARRGSKLNGTATAVLSGSDENFAMKEDEEATKSMDSKVGENENSNEVQQPPAGGILSRISGGVYDKTATVVGGVGWIAGTALSTSYSAVTSVGGFALRPFRKLPKDKAD